jgi:hypothetical protein
MTGLFFALQARLSRMRETGELSSQEYGRGVSPHQYRKVLGGDDWEALPEETVATRLKTLLAPKRHR